MKISRIITDQPILTGGNRAKRRIESDEHSLEKSEGGVMVDGTILVPLSAILQVDFEPELKKAEKKPKS